MTLAFHPIMLVAAAFLLLLTGAKLLRRPLLAAWLDVVIRLCFGVWALLRCLPRITYSNSASTGNRALWALLAVFLLCTGVRSLSRIITRPSTGLS